MTEAPPVTSSIQVAGFSPGPIGWTPWIASRYSISAELWSPTSPEYMSCEQDLLSDFKGLEDAGGGLVDGYRNHGSKGDYRDMH